MSYNIMRSIARDVAMWIRDGKSMGQAIALVARSRGIWTGDVEFAVEFVS